MTVPSGAEDSALAELVLNLPPNWPMSHETWLNEASYWPIRLQKMLARLPHEHATWLSGGHTVQANSDGSPYHPSTAFTGSLISPCISPPPEFSRLELGSRRINFWSILPLYPEEMTYKLKKGVDALFDRFDAAGLSDAVAPGRKNVCKRSWFPWRA